MAKVANEYLPLSVIGEFPAHWKVFTLTDVCTQVTDGTHDSPKPVDKGGFPLVTGKAIKDRRIDFSVTYNISEIEHLKVLERSKPEKNDILFANIGNSIGDLVRVKTDTSFSIKNVALFKPDTRVIDPRFLEYFLLSESVQSFIKGSTRGSAQPFIGLGTLRGFPIAVPPIAEQEQIGDILSALDDRITLLRETNTTLEAIAQVLFKSWFVDFDPVHAKQQGRIPEGMDEATAALFPDSFEESELCSIPKGWITSTVEKSFILTMGQSPPGNTYNELNEGLPFFQGRTDFGFRFPTQRIFCSSPTRLAERGDTLVSVRAPVGDLNMALEKCAIGRGVASVREPNGYQSYAFYATKSLHTHFSNFNGEGTIFGSINKKDFQNIPIVSPSKAIIKAFNDTAVALDARIDTNERMIRSLANIRNTLLPRLIFGSLHLTSGIETEELMPNEN